MKADWQPLDTELARWQADGLSLPLWWRDDDAVAVTPQLDRLTMLTEKVGLPVHLAVIPRDAQAPLAGYVRATPSLIPVVHGWAHENHAPAGEKKSEFGLHRPIDTILYDAQSGLSHLQEMFGSHLRTVFVPPWNRIAPEVIVHLSGIGFDILSTATPRKATMAAPGLAQVNTHLDPIDWRGTRGLVSPDTLIIRTAELLRNRREGHTDNAEAFGILTHHLVHDEEIWTFTHNLLHKLLDGPGVIWTAPQTKKPEESPK